jgi:serine/threonine protein kinase
VIKKEECSFPADIWSLGVILYKLITFEFPYDDSSSQPLFNSIITRVIPIIKGNWASKLKNVIFSMLQLYPKEKISFAQLEEDFSIFSDLNNTPEEFFHLGMIYFKGNDVTKNLKVS